MKILNINVNGLKSKYNNLVEYINKNNFDLITLQEIKIKKNDQIINNLEKDVNGFAFINSNYGNHGVGIIVRNNIKQFTVKEILN